MKREPRLAATNLHLSHTRISRLDTRCQRLRWCCLFRTNLTE